MWKQVWFTTFCTIAGIAIAGTPALHPEFVLKDVNGESVLLTGNPLSTMQTCGSCHDTQFIVSHSSHSDAGLSTMNTFEPSTLDYPWDQGPGYFGKWNPLNYRLVSSKNGSPTDLDQARWIMDMGFRHVGGGPAEFNLDGLRLDQQNANGEWDWEASGVVEMNCFLCHMPQPDNTARHQALQAGQFDWANSATLSKTNIITKTGDRYSWNPAAFNKNGEVKRAFLTPTDPSNSNCGQCHGLVFTATDVPEGLRSCDWNTATTGEIIAPQKINRTGFNLKSKTSLSRSWDIHTERAVQCVDCHPSANNPIYYQDSKAHKLDHLKFDARRIDVVDFLYRPSHEFARGGLPGEAEIGNPGETMRSCETCHDANVTHNWLPYKQAHFDKVSCESCHIPRMHGPAYEQIDWTVLSLEKEAVHDCRGAEGDPRDITMLIEGFEPILLPTSSSDKQARLKPYNLISAWYWVSGDDPRPVRKEDLEQVYFKGAGYRAEIIIVFDADGDGQISKNELRIDTVDKEAKVRHELQALGLSNVRIQADVQAYKINHDVTNGKWATRKCASCHGNESRIAAPFELSGYIPGDVLPIFVGDLDLGKMGSLTRDTDGSLSYQLDVSGSSLYVFGLSHVTWIDWGGLLLLLGTMAGIAVHGGYRVMTARQRSTHEMVTHRVYMYRFYERLWHWVQVMAIFLLLITGLIIHRPELLGVFSFPYMVVIHNALGLILFANAFLAVFYHLVSGEIKQYIPQPRGFFDQAVAQASYYLKGIFKGDPHPFEKSRAKKLNPLQQLTYFGLLNFLLPLQIITGLLIWSVQTWPEIADKFGGLPVLGPFHTLLAWVFASFILLHMYLTTTGHKPLDGIKAMINGWDELDDHAAQSAMDSKAEEKDKK